jgi:hypothetical protein
MTIVNATSKHLPTFRTMGGEVAALHDGTKAGITYQHGQYVAWITWANATVEVYKGRSFMEATFAFNAANAAVNVVTSDLILHYSDVRLVGADMEDDDGDQIDEITRHAASVGAVDLFTMQDAFTEDSPAAVTDPSSLA